MVEHVGGLLADALVGLLACGARDLLGLLADLLPRERRILEQLDGVGARRALRGARGERALEDRERLVRGRRFELAVVEARPFAGVAGGPGGLERGKCVSRYCIWSASTRRPLR